MELIIIIVLSALVITIPSILYFKFKKRSVPGKANLFSNSGRREYQFANGLKCAMEWLTIAQEKALLDLLVKLDLKDWSDLANIDFNKLHKVLVEADGLCKFLDIILLDKEFSGAYVDPDTYYNTLHTPEVEVIIKDFFSLNPSKLAILQNTVLTAASQMLNTIPSMGGEKKRD
ncbi:MAG: hypothetical protein IAE90_07480 [Ignavibacteria bacterium]|nr:hypothetical protein [Ignavibacteria bacterium]